MQHRESFRTDGVQQSIGPFHFSARGVLLINRTSVDAQFYDDAGFEYDAPAHVAATYPLAVPTSRLRGALVAAKPASDTGSLSATVTDAETILSTAQLSTINLSGFPVKVLHNGVVVASEPGLDFVDATGLVWAISDDAPNSRIRVAAPVPPGTQMSRATAGTAGPTGVTSTGIGDPLLALPAFTADGVSNYDVELSMGGLFASAAGFIRFIVAETIGGTPTGLSQFARVPVTTSPTAFSYRFPLVGVLAAGVHTPRINWQGDGVTGTYTINNTAPGDYAPLFARVVKAG